MGTSDPNAALVIAVPGLLTEYKVRTDTPKHLLEDLAKIRRDPAALPQDHAAAGKILKGFDNMLKKGVKLDLVFCVDQTGSMQDDIIATKEAILGLMNHVEAARGASREKWPLDVRVALVLFRDIEDGDDQVFQVLQSTDDLSLVAKVLDRTDVDGGGGNPGESGLEAVAIAIGGQLAAKIPSRFIANALAGVVPGEKAQGDCSITHREGVPQLLFVVTDEPPLTRNMPGRNLKRVFFTLPEIAKALADGNFIVTIAAHEHCGYADWGQLTQDMIPIADLRADTFHGRFDARDTFLIAGAKANGHDLGPMGKVVEAAVATELTKVVAGVAAEAQKEVLLLTGGKPSTYETRGKDFATPGVISLGA